jgi:hypothetical protein
VNAVAEEARCETGHDIWEKENKNELGFSRNPFNKEHAIKQVNRTREEKLAREEVLDYAIEVFLNKIEDNDERSDHK